MVTDSIKGELTQPLRAGAGHYAAANSVLDGLAEARHSAGLPSVALQFGPFAEAGMAAQHAQQLAALGLLGLKPQKVAHPLRIRTFTMRK